MVNEMWMEMEGLRGVRVVGQAAEVVVGARRPWRSMEWMREARNK
jgi:hypothetical protein